MRLTRLAILTTSALALLAFFTATAHAGDAAKAKRNLASAKDAAQSERWDNLAASMKRAEADMEGLSDAEKAPLLAEITAIKAIVTKSVEDDVNKRLEKAAADPDTQKFNIQRATMRLDSDEAKNYADAAAIDKLKAKVAKLSGAPAPEPSTPAPAPKPPAAGKPELTGDLKAAAVRIEQARGMMKQGDRRFAETMMGQARKLLQDIPEKDKAPLLAEMAALDKQIELDELKAQRDEEYRRVDEQVSRYVGTAEGSIQNGIVTDSEWLEKSEKLLATHDVKTFLPAAEIQKYQARLDAFRKKLREHNKAVALSNSANTLKELEEKVAADPLKGLQGREAYEMFGSVKYLGDRVRGEFTRVPHDDPKIKAVLDRVDAAHAKLEAAAGEYALETMRKQLAENWKFSSDHFAGWESEALDPKGVEQRRVEGLTKTTQAVTGTVHWLNDADTKQTLEKHKNDAAVQALAKTVRKTLEDAVAKLDKAFNTVLAEAERQPMPPREADRTSAIELAGEAESWFAGTKYKDANVARAKALDDKWKAEVARIEKERAETRKRMTDEATAAWAKIEPAVAAERGFDPADADNWKGKTIKIKGYYNRTGWDFDSTYHYACDIKGVPVAGDYAPHVLAAYNDVQNRTHYGIDDHTGWDLIAVVEGKGQINRRVTTEWKDKDTRQVLFKTESHVAEPCVLIKIIGLHTGPLAVGPK